MVLLFPSDKEIAMLHGILWKEEKKNYQPTHSVYVRAQKYIFATKVIRSDSKIFEILCYVLK